MGLKPKEVKSLLLKDFWLMFTGYQRREDKEWNRTRHLMAFIQTFGGMGASKFANPQSIWPLPLDDENKKQFITSLAQAKALFKEFM